MENYFQSSFAAMALNPLILDHMQTEVLEFL